jgi:hypothetical protein
MAKCQADKSAGEAQNELQHIRDEEAMGLMQVLTDPKTSVAQALHAILVAEMPDNVAWEELIELTGTRILSRALPRPGDTNAPSTAARALRYAPLRCSGVLRSCGGVDSRIYPAAEEAWEAARRAASSEAREVNA